MRIQRYRYPPSARRRRQGCLPFSFLLGLLTAGLLFSWGWISQTLWPPDEQNVASDLSDAQAALASGNLTGAIAQARTVYEHDRMRSDALALLVRSLIYYSYDDYDTAANREFALQLTTRALQANPNDPMLLSLHAFAQQTNIKSLDAYNTAKRARMIRPQDALAQIVTGLAYGGIGSYDRALNEHQAVTTRLTAPGGFDIDPSDSMWRLDAVRGLAIAYSDLGRYQDALQTVNRAIQMNSSLSVLYFERALYAMQLGDNSTATDSYFEILARNPNNVKARLRLCEISSVSRDRVMAMRYCQEVTERAPAWSEGWYKLGREHFLSGHFKEAQHALNRCSTLQVIQGVPVTERRFECWYLQGQAAEINGDCNALRSIYQEFVAMTAEQPISQTWVYPPEGPAICVQ